MSAKVNIKNGVNVENLIGTIEAIKEDPEIAKFQFRSQTNWISGGHCQTKIKDFYGAKTENTSRKKALIIEGDEPAILLGSDNGANAVEALLHALASCLCTGFVYNASAQNITIKSLQFNLEGDINLEAFLGLSDANRAGYENISVTCIVDADASKEELEKLFEYVKKTSPVLDMISNPVPVWLKMV